MAKGYKSGGRDWKPGQSGNLLGLGVHRDPEMKKLSKLSPGYVSRLIAKLAQMTGPELLDYLQQPQHANNMEMMIASIITRAISEADHTKVNFLLDRSIGKVVEEKRVSIQPVTYITSILPDGGLIQEIMMEETGETIEGEETIDVNVVQK